MATPLSSLLTALRASRGFAHKRDIAAVMAQLAPALLAGAERPDLRSNGDDCAVLPQPDGSHLLLAIEGLMPDFVQHSPWFAGYSAVLVNLSDVAAMGGRPLAVVDALWSPDAANAAQVLAGMQAACARYGVPLVGGHSNLRSPSAQLAVAVLGQARAGLISSFAAQVGDRLLVALDLRGQWHGEQAFWNASTEAPPERLCADLAVLAELAEAGLCDAGKDISMAGVLGTLLMLLEGSRCGAEVDLQALPVPTPERWPAWPGWQCHDAAAQAAQLRWLGSFPSYGYLLAVRPAHAQAVQARFAERGLACADIGSVQPGGQVQVRVGDSPPELLWDLAQAGFIHPDRQVAEEAAHVQ